MKSIVLFILVVQAAACDLYYWDPIDKQIDSMNSDNNKLEYDILPGLDYPSYKNCGLSFDENNKISIKTADDIALDVLCYSNFRILLKKDMIPINLLQDSQYVRFDISYRAHDFIEGSSIIYHENIRFRIVSDGKIYSSIGSLPSFDMALKPEFRREIITCEIPELENQKSIDLFIEIERHTFRNAVSMFPDKILTNPASITINSIEQIRSL